MFVAESGRLKALDKVNLMRKKLMETEEELSYLANSGSLLPQSEKDLSIVKQVAKVEPERIVSRLDYLMTELNFLMDIVSFKRVDPKLKGLIQQHLFSTLDIAHEQGMLMGESQSRNLGTTTMATTDMKGKNTTTRSDPPIDDPDSL